MTKKWFKPKNYGYGFYPISWEGWICTLVLLGFIFVSAYINNLFSDIITLKEGLRYVLDVLMIASIATYFFEKKMEGELKWNWGKKK